MLNGSDGTDEELTQRLEAELAVLRRRKAFTERAVKLAEEMLAAADTRNTACLLRLQYVENELETRYTAAAERVAVAPLPTGSADTFLSQMTAKTEDFVLLHEAATAQTRSS